MTSNAETPRTHFADDNTLAYIAELEKKLAASERMCAQAIAALQAIEPFISEDFPNGPSGPTAASLAYQVAYGELLGVLAAQERSK